MQISTPSEDNFVQMNVSNSNTQRGGGSHKGEERMVQSSSLSSLPSPSAQHKTRTRPQRSFKKGKSNTSREANSLISNNAPIPFPEERTDNRSRNNPNPSSPLNLNSIDQEQKQLAREWMDRQFPPSIPTPTQGHVASAPLAIRTNPRRQQRAPPIPLLPPKQPHDAKYECDRDSCLDMGQAAIQDQAQEPSSNIIETTPEYMFHLNSLVAKPGKLREIGYVLNPLSMEDMELKKRCHGCGKKMATFLRLRERNKRERESKKSKDGPRKSNHNLDGDKDSSQADKENEKCGNDGTKPSPKKIILDCKFHPGIPTWNGQRKTWSCCYQHMSADPCSGAEQHYPRFYLPRKMESLWQFHPTPQTPNISSPDIRAAVAIDCEMGQAASGDSELIRITLVDYFSSAVLIDSLVYPSEKMEHYRTKFSGVNRREMEAARRAGTCIMGRDNARFSVWRYVGPETVVVGHSAHNDLESLRWIHSVVVDTYIIEARLQKKKEDEAKKDEGKPKDGNATTGKDETHRLATKPNGNEHVQNEDSIPGANPDEASGKDKQEPRKRKNKGSGKLSLKTLTRERLGRDIQNAGKEGHDSLEDALAARDLVHWHIVNGGMIGLDDGKEKVC
ncbi:hypothetical protein EMCG_08505 [[Emmonsia] crescens]|uniref:Exonuclease domain-containing protein n=1 Tax=[Emmonsia] crescens TaxID=73230 RepID=A0A0G2JAG0_9EURO|nr:hypothetical protein EMCG_08505 [Emmonsia crescens UAMH 3008]